MIVDTPVDLLAGHDYVLVAGDFCDAGPGTAILRGPNHVVVATVSVMGLCIAGGEEFRAQYTATYFIEYDDAVVTAEVVPDCRKDLATLCRLAVNHTKEGTFQWYGDTDTFKVSLNRAYTYVFSMTGYSDDDNSRFLRIMDSHGVVLNESYTDNDSLGTLTFHPSRTGTYYFQGDCAAEDHGFHYTLTLRIRR
jgi:hypothetical protein